MTTPTIALSFHQTAPLGCDPAALLACLQEYVDKYVGPAWGVGCKLVIDNSPHPGEWVLAFADDADQAGTLGYHQDDTGTPLGFVFVRTSAQAGESVSVTASHELAEMLVDPGANLGAFTPRGRWAALEVADPCEEDTFTVGGLPVSDFVLPTWFGQPGPNQYDHLGLVTAAFQVRPGGYIPLFDLGKWTQLFGSHDKRKRFRREDRRLHRTERRKRKTAGTLREVPAATHA